MVVQDMIGQKQYEITDHLGNVLSTVSDQHLGRDINGDSVIDYYNAVIPAAYDYYPFGMLMPFRYTQDNSTHCATITTDKLYPAWVHHNIILNNGTTPIANSYGSGVATVLTGGTGINIYSPMITSGATISVPLQQKLAYYMDLNIQSISGSYSAQVLDSDSTVLGAITIAESGNFSLSYSAPSASPVTLVFKAQSAGSNISLLAAGYWVFTHQSQMVTMTICDQNDNYRFGFNGKLKDNEWAGLGNHYDFKFRGYDSRICRFIISDPISKKFPWNSNYCFAENDVIRAIDLEGLEKVIVFGGADLLNTGLSKTTLQTANDIQKFSNENHLNYEVKTFNVAPTNPSFIDAYKYIKANYKKDEPIIIYGYSMGGVAANQLAKVLKKDNIKVNLIVTVDAAWGLLSKPIEIPDNVKININFYQTSRSNFPIFSRGFPAKPMSGNYNTTILNFNYDGKTEEKGSDAHGSMDESTQKSAENLIKVKMTGQLNGVIKDSQEACTPPQIGTNTKSN